MWKQILKHQWVTAILVVLGAVLLTGCGNENEVDYSIDGLEEEAQAQGDGGKSGLSQFEGEESWKDTWSLGVGDMSIDAEVITPMVTHMSVLEVAEPDFSAEYKEVIANRIFEEVYYGDPLHLPKKDLEAVSNSISEFMIIHYAYPPADNYDQKWYDWNEAVDNMETAGDSYVPVTEYTVDEYIGLLEGRMYNLFFTEVSGNKDFIRRLKLISMTPKNIYEVCPEKFKDQEDIVYSEWQMGEWAQNHCGISEAEARKEAEVFAEKLGLDYPIASAAYPLVWGELPEVFSLDGAEDESDSWEVNGYVFSFDLGVDDISFVNFGMEESYFGFWGRTDREEEIQYSLQARLQIYVTDQGVIRAEINNPVEITGMQDDVELLPLDTIKGIMQKEVTEHPELFRFNTYQFSSSFNEMELIYFRVRDKEHPGKFNYVPTWRLAAVTRVENENLNSILNQVLINAIDGSVIDFFDET